MRYEDWDILLFPWHSEIPAKEFRVACHVVPDLEFSHIRESSRLPTLCCFVPSMPAGSLFRVSVHSWTEPVLSQLTKAYTQHLDSAQFEARVYIDGQLTASTILSSAPADPLTNSHRFDFSKNGDLPPLKFPAFRQEILQQNYWSPADDLGRVKIIISEGFPRDSLSMPFERVKNVVAFSFQHAPLEILQGSSIAWPNSLMWNRPSAASTMAAPSQAKLSHAHGHSARFLPKDRMPNNLAKTARTKVFGAPSMPSHVSQSRRPAQSGNGGRPDDPASDRNAYFDWLNGLDMDMRNQGHGDGRPSGVDTTMADYAPMTESDIDLGLCNDSTFDLSFLPEQDSLLAHLKPRNNAHSAYGLKAYAADAVPIPARPNNSGLPSDMATSLTTSLLNQPLPLQTSHDLVNRPASEVRSRKENREQTQDQHRHNIPSTADARYPYLATGQCDTAKSKVSPQAHAPSDVASSTTTAQSENDLSGTHFMSNDGAFDAHLPQYDAKHMGLDLHHGDSPKEDGAQGRVSTPASLASGAQEGNHGQLPERVSPQAQV